MGAVSEGVGTILRQSGTLKLDLGTLRKAITIEDDILDDLESHFDECFAFGGCAGLLALFRFRGEEHHL